MAKENATKQQKSINSLTPEQEALLPIYKQRYEEYGLNTAPMDNAAAEKAVLASYAYLSKTRDVDLNPYFIWTGSFRDGAKTAAQIATQKAVVTQEDVLAQREMAAFGSLEAYWVSVYAFIGEQLPVERDELLDIVIDLVKHCGAYWTFDGCVVMSPRPISIKLKDGKLHCVDGLALEYPDGQGTYAYEGVAKSNLAEILMIAKGIGVQETEAE